VIEAGDGEGKCLLVNHWIEHGVDAFKAVVEVHVGGEIALVSVGVAEGFVVAWVEAGTGLAVGGEDLGSDQAGTAVALIVDGRLVRN
jgi:hypothetical protein